ncbi:MAG: LPS export ABC transporter periplasmic protein LptC [Bdellovibrionales bacterium]|nr:LPS export ABC transporter periplasmic protein LptC [Bdellovibrionales bacterium]
MGLFFFFVAHLLLLSPSSLEEDFTGMRVIHPKDLLSFLRNDPESLESVPFLRSVAPTYSARDGVLYSTEKGKPRFRLLAKKTNLYQENQIVHIRESRIFLEDGTEIESKEALYDLVKSQVTFMGSVQSRFKGGAIVESERAILDMRPVMHLFIPTNEAVHGKKTNLASPLLFESMGLEYSDTDKTIRLLSKVKVRVTGPKPLEVVSDHCDLIQSEDLLEFWMDDSRIIERQFVVATDPGLYLKSRRMEVRLRSGREVREIIALQDVFFENQGDPASSTQGTGGRGIYRVPENEITLTEFPQLYQDRDTVTGDTITYNRNLERVEVIQSNAIYNTTPTSNR